MARQNEAIEYNSHVKGIITEAGPLTFPEGASLDEVNFELHQDGSRSRRLGMGRELNGGERDTPQGIEIYGQVACTTFTWKTRSTPVPEVLVVQLGDTLRFYDKASEPLEGGAGSNGLLYEFTRGVPGDFERKYSYSSVGGTLVVTNASTGFLYFTIDDNGVISQEDGSIKVRDIWGVDPLPDQSFNLRSPQFVDFRPTFITTGHRYNLRNQSWGLPRKPEGGEKTEDPIDMFFSAIGEDGVKEFGEQGVYPSNSDYVSPFLFPNPENSSDGVGDRFWPKSMAGNHGPKSPSPRGYFVIDLFRRGSSREDVASENEERHGLGSGSSYSELPADYTVRGPTCVSSYAGRVWFGGFGKRVVNGDDMSPDLSTYIAFSRLVEGPQDIGLCYQHNDPTSKNESDLLDTDGGVLNIPDAEEIMYLIDVGGSLLVFCSNGVWSISGGSQYGFSATNYRVDKISNLGLLGKGTVVETDTGVFFWSTDGIYNISQDESGLLSIENVSESSIQSLFNSIEYPDKVNSEGFFDRYERKVKWLYGTRLDSSIPTSELIFDTNIGAFYKNEIHNGSITNLDVNPYPLAYVSVPPYRSGTVEEPVQVIPDTGTSTPPEDVFVNGEQVIISSEQIQTSIRETKFVFAYKLNGVWRVGFSLYNNPEFEDWWGGDDAEAYTITGYAPGQDFQRNKGITYLTMHMLRTEDGVEDVGGGDLVPTNQSSCLVQARWDWANSAASNRWGREFQAYRYRRPYMPTGELDDFDTGFETIVTKNRVRGKGRVVSFRMRSEPKKNCIILGWSVIMGINGNV